MVQARYIRVWPHSVPHSDRQPGFFLWVELLGCEPVSPPVPPCPGAGHRCANGECALPGVPCDGAADCEDGSDEEGCGPLPVDTGRGPQTLMPGAASGHPEALSPWSLRF
ncbi:Hypothetical predicted protein [Marmota monax]|nr:Hypothetical predicted protein [Marmota monax]